MFRPPGNRGRDGLESIGSDVGKERPSMCYTRRDQQFEEEARRITENRLMEEEIRHRFEEHDRRREQEGKPLTEKVREMVGAR